MPLATETHHLDSPPSLWTRVSVLHLVVVLIEYALVGEVIWKFQLLSPAFLVLLFIVGGGVAVTHLLPLNWRMSFFALLSIGGIAGLLGPWPTLWLVLLGAMLLGLAHLPVAYWLRVVLLIAVGLGLAVFRYDPSRVPQVAIIWPILGSMFMFRMIIYMYDLRHHAAPFSLSRSVAYFFMLPNVLFPLFPVVDYKTFCRTHNAGHPLAIAQKGIEWMLRGVVHLIIYRVIYQHYIIDSLAVESFGQAVQYIAMAFLRYFQVTGSFHLVIGLLCLFGFNLPDAFNRWFLASGFADMWRRINIYWKDFMQKVFFTPALFAFKKRVGETTALILATAVVMFVTWILHIYQTFWVGGRIHNSVQDSIFWTFLGLAIMTNLTLEMRFGRTRTLTRAAYTWRGDLWLGVRTALYFSLMCFAWSMWSSRSLADWMLVLGNLAPVDVAVVGKVALALTALGVAAVLSRRFPRKPRVPLRPGAPIDQRFFWRSVILRVASCVIILTIAKWPELLLPVSPEAADMVRQARVNRLNSRDARQLQRGYYEDLFDVSQFNPELAELYAQRPIDWNINPASRQRDPGDFPPHDLMPGVSEMYKGALFETNRWGMRDRDYEQHKPEGVFRIALMGSSHVVGVGVEGRDVFANLVEDRLNRELGVEHIRRVEVLNFSVSGYGPLCCLATLEQRILAFEPDLFLYAGMADPQMLQTEIGHATVNRRELPYEHVQEVLDAAGIKPGHAQIATERAIAEVSPDLLKWIYARMVSRCREQGVAAAALLIPRPSGFPSEHAIMLELGAIEEAAGFEVLDAGDVYAGVEDVESLWIAPWDHHPSALGHRLLADGAYDAVAPLVRRLATKRDVAPAGD